MTNIKAYFYNEKTQKFAETNIKVKDKQLFYAIEEIENRSDLIKEDAQIENIFQHVIIHDLLKTDINKLSSLKTAFPDEGFFFAFCDPSSMGKSDFLHKVQEKLEYKRKFIQKRADILNNIVNTFDRLESESSIEEHSDMTDPER